MGNITIPGFRVVSSPEQLRTELLAAGDSHPIRIIYRALGGTKEWHFDKCCQLVLARRRIVFFADEIDAYTKAGSMPKPFYDVVHFGRHRMVACLCTARRSTDVPRGMTSQCWEKISFRQREKNDLRWWADEAGESFANELPRLGKYEYLLLRDDGEETILKGGGKQGGR